MVGSNMTRRGFLASAAGLLSFVALGFLGCGKKPEEKAKVPKEAPPEMTQEEKEEYVFATCICKKCPSYVECGEKAGYCLVRGQLQSGGWDYRIYFDPKQRSRYAYRVDAELEGRHDRNTSTLDDNTTQAALRLLMRLDETLDFKDEKIHEAAQYGLKRLLAVQYPIGAWPPGWLSRLRRSRKRRRAGEALRSWTSLSRQARRNQTSRKIWSAVTWYALEFPV